MPEIYDQAALRHWADSRLLAEASRIPNADHLVGLAAECAIKFGLVRAGFVDAEGRLRGFHLHVEALWGRVRLQNLQKRFPGLWAALQTPSPFSDWTVEQRYDGENSVLIDALTKHSEGARRLLGAVQLLGARRGER